MRAPFSKGLDKSSAPVFDRQEFERAFAAVHAKYPGIELGYVGYKNGNHYFQLWGDPVAYVVTSAGWVPKRSK